MKKIKNYQGNEAHLEELKGFIKGMGLTPEIKDYEEDYQKYTSIITDKILVRYNKSINSFEILLIETPSEIKKLEETIGKIFESELKPE